MVADQGVYTRQSHADQHLSRLLSFCVLHWPSRRKKTDPCLTPLWQIALFFFIFLLFQFFLFLMSLVEWSWVDGVLYQWISQSVVEIGGDSMNTLWNVVYLWHRMKHRLLINVQSLPFHHIVWLWVLELNTTVYGSVWFWLIEIYPHIVRKGTLTNIFPHF